MEENYKPTEFLENHRDFFEDFTFKFEGLTPEVKKGYEKAVKDLGADLSDDTKYIFADESYFKLDENKKRTDLYDITYILDSLEAGKVLNIESYKYCYENVFSAACYKENNEGNNISNNDGNVIENDELMDVETVKNQDEIDKNQEESDTLPKINKKNENKSSRNNSVQHISRNKTHNNVFTEKENNISVDKLPNFTTAQTDVEHVCELMDLEASESQNEIMQNKDRISALTNNDRKKGNYQNESINMRQELEDSRNNLLNVESDISIHEEKPKIKSETDSKDNLDLDETQFTKNIIEIIRKNENINSQLKNNNKNNKDTGANYKQFKKTKTKYKRIIEISDEDNDLMSEDITRPSTSKNVRSNNNKKNLGTTSGWIDPKSIKISTSPKNIANTIEVTIKKDERSCSSSASDISYHSDEDEKKIDLGWWMKQEIPDNEICKFKSCSFEPVRHRQHAFAGRMMSEEEKKILIKYLIMNNTIHHGKGLKVWEAMIEDGYLTHRTPETLRNCLRRTILPQITSFGLPTEILDKFLDLDGNKTKGRKKG